MSATPKPSVCRKNPSANQVQSVHIGDTPFAQSVGCNSPIPRKWN